MEISEISPGDTVRALEIAFFNFTKLKNDIYRTYFNVLELKNEMKGGERYGL